MIKSINKKPSGPLEIDLTGPDGNAIALMAIARNISKAIGNTSAETDEIIKEMMSSDYEYLLSVMEKNFSEHIIMYR